MWGEAWGTMIWDAVAQVPSIGAVGAGLLTSLLIGCVGLERRRTRHARARSQDRV